MDMVCGKVFLVMVIWANGRILKLMDTEFINGRTVIGMKVVGTIALSMARDLIFLQTVIHILEIMFMVNLMARESTNGKMEVFTKEDLRMV